MSDQDLDLPVGVDPLPEEEGWTADCSPEGRYMRLVQEVTSLRMRLAELEAREDERDGKMMEGHEQHAARLEDHHGKLETLLERCGDWSKVPEGVTIAQKLDPRNL